ncbi:MAG: methyltransferase domain-containing protein [Candidatus Kapaibacterium sp.]
MRQHNSATPTYRPRFTKDQLRRAIRETYKEVAKRPAKNDRFTLGQQLAEFLGYPADLLDGIPNEAIASFAGAGNPFDSGPVVVGETILDVGCGAGMDSLIAARLTGEGGKVIGVDMTNEMVNSARRNAREMGAWNARYIIGFAERLPLGSETIDLIISNGVVNLSPEKEQVFDEMYRVLKPGGRIQIADVLLQETVPDSARDLLNLWTDCIAGGEEVETYLGIMQKVGFRHIEFCKDVDLFRGTRVEERARRFGAYGYTIRGWK